MIIAAFLAVILSVPAPSVRTVVSDTNRFTCGSGSVASLSSDGTRVFAPYLASTNGFGECHDLAAIADVPVADSGRARSFVVCGAGETFLDVSVSTVVSYASFPWEGKVRVALDVNFDRFGFRDWDPQSRRVTGEGLFMCRWKGGGEIRPLSPDAISDYLRGLGLTGFNPKRETGDQCIFQSKPQWKDGFLYGFVTSACSQPILFRSADGTLFEFIGAIPEIAEYECQLAILNGRLYAVMRGAKGDNFWTSSDGGRTWKSAGRLPDGLQRPQMMVWKDKVLIGYSAPDEKPCSVRNGRNNLHLLWGEGTDLSQYREILHVLDPIGFVYPDLVDIRGELHVLWSNSERFPDKVKWGAVQGKDQILFARLTPAGK